MYTLPSSPGRDLSTFLLVIGALAFVRFALLGVETALR